MSIDSPGVPFFGYSISYVPDYTLSKTIIYHPSQPSEPLRTFGDVMPMTVDFNPKVVNVSPEDYLRSENARLTQRVAELEAQLARVREAAK